MTYQELLTERDRLRSEILSLQYGALRNKSGKLNKSGREQLESTRTLVREVQSKILAIQIK